MNQSTATAATARTSTIPRLSRLPLPRPSSSLDVRSQPPALAPSVVPSSLARPGPRPSLGRQSLHGTIRGRPSLLPPPTPRTAIPAAKNATAAQRQPVKPVTTVARPAAKPAQRPAAPVSRTSYIPPPSRKPLLRQTSDQENEPMEEENQENDDSAHFSGDSITSPAPSLTDRTLETLLHAAPTPGTGRRRSSFFNPHTPMTSARPSTVMENCSVSKLNYGSVRRTALPRPSSPLKTSTAANTTPGAMRPPARRVSSLQMTKIAATPVRPPLNAKQAASVARLSAPATRPEPTPDTIRPTSAASTSRRTSTAFTIPPLPTPRPASALSTSGRASALARPSSSLSSRIPSAHVVPRPSIATALSNRGARPAVSRLPSSGTTTATDAKCASSAALRLQIAQAKAARKQVQDREGNTAARDVKDGGETVGLKDMSSLIVPVTALGARIETGRKYGRLNISGMSLKNIPEEVLSMYTPDSLEQSSISWFEAVPISHLVAADNDFESIQDEAFPDHDDKENEADGRGKVFGGVESIDLHGNLLTRLPQGLSRLDFLTSLNLSRNKLDNGALEVISKVSRLRALNISSNDLCKEVPEAICQLTNLETLDISHNKLVLLPASLHSLVHLQIIDLSNNRFSDLSMDSLSFLPNLTELRASNNALTGSLFPSTVDSLPTLEILDVSNNSLASLSFSDSLVLPALTHLDVSRNRLYALPDISHWATLLNLLAEDNSLTTFPIGFTSLQQLRKADFKGNSFRRIDIGVANMRGLDVLNLTANPLTDRRLTTLGWQSLRAELLRRVEEGELAARGWASKDSAHESLAAMDENAAVADSPTVDFWTPKHTEVDDDETF